MLARRAIDLLVCGAGPAYSDRPGATGAAYLLRFDGHHLLLDLGQGSFPRLSGWLDPADLDAVVISHLHPDHFIDLVSLRHYLVYDCEPPRRVTVHGPAQLAKRLDALHADDTFTSAALDAIPLREQTIAIGPFELQAARVTHTDDSYGFRIWVDGGPGIVYSGDCGRAADLVPLIRPGDTLLSEVAFGPGPVAAGAQHLDGPTVADLASATAAGRVLLTHLQMGFDPAATLDAVTARFSGDARFISPGDELAV